MTDHAARREGPTRARILEVAVKEFAEKGYRDARVAEICHSAQANVAAVNYHFGSKENLYREALRTAFQRSLERHPIDGGVPASAPVEERLRGHIFATVRRMKDPEGHEFDIIHKEMANPTGLVAESLREAVEPIRRATLSIVREIVGPKASEEQVALCQRSIMGQCLHYMMRSRPGMLPGGPPPVVLQPDEIAEHIFRFSLAGLRETRRFVESAPNAGAHKDTQDKAGTP